MTNEYSIFDEVKRLKFEDGIYIQHTALQEISSLEGYDMVNRLLTFKNLQNFIHLMRVWLGYNFVSKYAGPFSVVVDLGCGFAEIPDLLFCNRHKHNYYCLDFDIRKLKKVAERKIGSYNRVLVQNDLSRTELPFPDNSVDAVLCIETLEHIPLGAGIALLYEVNRKLKDDGVFLVTTPNVRNSKTVEAFHIYEWEYSELTETLVALGFVITDTFGLNIAKNITTLDSANKGVEDYEIARKILPSAIVKPFFSFKYPYDSRAFGLICRKSGNLDYDKLGAIDYSFSKERNKTQMERHEDWRKYSEKKLEKK